MAQRFYPAVLERDEGGLFAVWFPDFSGVVVAGRTQDEAMGRAQDALAGAIQDLAERDVALPEPTAFDAIELPPGCQAAAFVAMAATLPDPSERVNVYLPRSLIERVDRAAAAAGMSRSSLFGFAMARLLETPFPGLTGVAYAGFAARTRK